MYTWSPYPFLRITAAFVLGILLHKCLIFHNVLFIVFIGLSVSYLFYLLLKKNLKVHNSIIGNLGLLIISLIGFVNAFLFDKTNDKSHFIHSSNKVVGYSALVNSAAVEKEKYFVYSIELENIVSEDSALESSGSIQFYVRRKPNDTIPLRYGDRILVRGSPFRLSPPGNPHEFNFMKHMANQNIHFQQFTNAEDIKVIGYKPENSFIRWATNWRIYFSNKLDLFIQNKDEAAIAKALILGVKDGLDNKIKNSYASAGAMHVLAVSGLHAGIIHMILQFIFSPFIKRKPWRYILPVVSIICLWAFAMVTGLSPSIMRATTMFTIIIIGQYYFDRPNIFNSLAISALILLFYNPNFLFSVGFQLSYLAVAGIVYLFPMIYGLLDSKYWLIDKIWSISAVSIAAQIATSPISVYYFHQFPTYFLISNLVVIPAAFLVMSLGILLLISNLFFISDLVGFLLESIIHRLNTFVFQIEKMSFSLIDRLYINEVQAISIYFVLLSILMLVHYRKIIYTKLIFFSVLIISASGAYDIIHQFYAQKLVFYDIRGRSLIDRISGLRANLYAIEKTENIESITHKIEPNRLNNGLPRIHSTNVSVFNHSQHFKGFKVFVWQGKKIILISENIEKLKSTSRINCDKVVISNNAIKNLTQLSSLVEMDEVIIDSSNDYYTTKKMIEQCEKLGLAYHAIPGNNALTLEN